MWTRYTGCGRTVNPCAVRRRRYGDRVTDRDAPARTRGAVAESGAVTDLASVEVRRSSRRTRTVSAYRDGSRIVVLIPSRFSRQAELHWVQEMVARIGRTENRRRRGRRSDVDLFRRCRRLSEQHLGGRADPTAVRWVTSMRSRWASCTPVDRTIRVSTRLREMPPWVLDYVLVHELAHLIVPGHGTDFWSLVAAYPRAERARGYLDGVSAAAALPIADDLADDLADDQADDPRDNLPDEAPAQS